MSLSHLPTKDLTIQDHTLNLEAMLAPVRFQLVLKKHKALNKSIQKDRSFYDRKKIFTSKTFDLQKKFIERKKKNVLDAKLQMTMAPILQSSEGGSLDNSDEHESAASQQTRKDGRRCISETRRNSHSSGFYLRRSSHPDTRLGINICPQRLCRPQPPTTPPNYKKELPKIAFNVHVHTEKSSTAEASEKLPMVRFVEEKKPEDGHLNDRVNTFLKKQKEFNNKPIDRAQREIPADRDVLDMFGKKPKFKAPLIAKRYSKLALDMDNMYNMFEDFTVNESLDEFRRMARLASKLKLAYRLSRDQSFVPTMGVLKTKAKLNELTAFSKSRGQGHTDV